MSFGAPELLVILLVVPVFSIWALIDALVRPDSAWEQAGQNKVVWAVVIALTIPTWAPMFAFNVAEDNTWRGSRLPEHCASKEDIQGGHPQQGVGKTKTYGCYYSNARLLYTATLVKKP